MSKPNIDLANPLVNDAINKYKRATLKALEVSQTVEKAVIPIYFPPRINRKPIQVASGVLVNIKNEYFVFSASHVFDSMECYQLLTGDGKGNELVSFEGERFSTGKGKSGTHADDPVDASVFHIKSPMTKELKAEAITFETFDLSNNPVDKKSIFIMAGFRASKSNTAGNAINSKREGWVSREINTDEYASKAIDCDYNIALSFENQILLNGIWQTSPTPKGFSGGAIIRIDGLNFLDERTYNSNNKQLLSGIIIEQRRGRGTEDGVLIGTRINVYLSLIKHFLPDLINDIYFD